MEVRDIISVIDKAYGFLADETKLFKRGVAEFENLKVEMEILEASIKDSKQRWGVPREWLELVAEAARSVDLVIDACLFHVPQRRRQSGFNTFVRHTTADFQKLFKRGPGLASSIQQTVTKLQHIKDEKQKSFVEFLLEDEFRRSRGVGLLDNGCHYFEKEELVGFDSEEQRLLRTLVGGPSTRLVTSLAGIGGVGKTALASVVFTNKVLERRFDCHAWISVSPSYDMETLLRHMTRRISSAGSDCIDGETDTTQELISRLNQYLSTKRYVIVFDGVWQTDFLQAMNNVLPNNNKGSRIIITTRDYAIAASCDIVQNLELLSQERAWELFCKLAFRHKFNGKCPPELENLSFKTVERCHGLPLLICAISDVLSNTKTDAVNEWRVLLKHFVKELRENIFLIQDVSRVFYQSYWDLHSRIRLCLLYFSMFPKDYLIPDLKLFKLWIAEGFIQEEIGKTLEEVAETYLNELIGKNLVQVSYVNYYGTERMCKVHGFMHDIISSRANVLRFYQVVNKGTSMSSVHSLFRRLSIYGDEINDNVIAQSSNVRSVLLFNVNGIMKNFFVMNLFERFRLLELLDFENAPLDDLPDEVGNLFLLKYLSLRNTKVKKLPKSVGLLLNLQTLDIRNTLIDELPIQIQRLQKLRHLLASAHNDKVSLDAVHGVRMNEGIGCLENLQTLMTMEAHCSGFDVIEELVKLRQLRWLSISNLTVDMVRTLGSFIKKMNHLESLNLYSSNENEIFDLVSISTPPPLLRRLVLKGRLQKLPDWSLGLQNLSVLGLSFSGLTADPMTSLQCLPNLNFLWLHQAYDGEQLHFKEVGFRRLKQLFLTELHDLKAIRIDTGALPLLEELRIGPSPNVLSFDIQQLKNLQLLEFYDMSEEFVLSLQPEGGSDYWKVKHVPSVVFRYRVRGSHYASYKLGEPRLLDHVKGLVGTTNVVFGRQLSFFCNDDRELARTSSAEWSDQYSFFTDDIED